MLDFKNWIFNEIVELKKPSNSVRRRNFIKNSGTNAAKPSIEYKFITKMNNEVKIHFDLNGEDSYRIIFYVNNTIFDDASKKQEGFDRDPEILSGVFYTVKEKARKLGAKKLNFEAYKSKNDDKFVKNIKIEPLKEKLLYDLKILYENLINHKVKMIQPSQRMIELKKRLGQEAVPYPDVDVEKLKKELINVIEIINELNDENKFIILNKLGGFKENLELKIYPNSEAAHKSLLNFLNAILSHSENGLRIEKNRRKIIYEKLIKRYFLDEWDYKIYGNSFYLTKKEL